MPSPDESIENFCKEIIAYLRQTQQHSPVPPHKPSTLNAPQTLGLIKKTQISVGEKIRELLESGKDEEKLLNLYVIDSTLYQLHHQNDQKEIAVLKKLCASIKTALTKQLTEIKSKRKAAEERFEKRVKWSNRMRVLCYIVGAVCAVLGFTNPDDVTIYLSITLLCLTQIFLFSDLWIGGAKTNKDRVFKANDPVAASAALTFLSPDHLIVLLEPPSYTPEYQERFVRMLVDLAIAWGWIPDEEVEIEDLMENSQVALEEAYSILPRSMDPAWIKKWRLSFEEIQLGLHHLFGDTLYQFNQKIKENLQYYYECFSELRESELGRHLQQFLKKTKYL